MKRIILMLLALTLMMTAFVACDENDTDNSSSAADVSSIEELTSEEQDAWGNTSLDVGGNSSSTSSNASSDKDQGFQPWVPLG